MVVLHLRLSSCELIDYLSLYSPLTDLTSNPDEIPLGGMSPVCF